MKLGVHLPWLRIVPGLPRRDWLTWHRRAHWQPGQERGFCICIGKQPPWERVRDTFRLRGQLQTPAQCRSLPGGAEQWSEGRDERGWLPRAGGQRALCLCPSPGLPCWAQPLSQSPGLLEAERRTLPLESPHRLPPLPADMFPQCVRVHLTLPSAQLGALIDSDVNRHLLI